MSIKNKFISNSKKIDAIISSLKLTKGLYVASLVVGESYNGKVAMVKMVYEDLICVDGANMSEVCKMIKIYDKLIIFNFHKLYSNPHWDFVSSGFYDTQIIAIADYESLAKTPQNINKHFAFVYEVPPLRKRNNDKKYFKNIFVSAITKQINNQTSNADNLKSLEIDAYKQVIFNNISQDDLEKLLKNYFDNNLDGTKTYKEYMQFYETILLKSGLRKFGSKMKLAKALSITRNTIRAKLNL